VRGQTLRQKKRSRPPGKISQQSIKFLLKTFVRARGFVRRGQFFQWRHQSLRHKAAAITAPMAERVRLSDWFHGFCLESRLPAWSSRISVWFVCLFLHSDQNDPRNHTKPHEQTGSASCNFVDRFTWSDTISQIRNYPLIDPELRVTSKLVDSNSGILIDLVRRTHAPG